MTPEFLLMCFDMKQPRRQRVIFGLLTNHLTVSTTFNGLVYQLLALINFQPQLTKEKYDIAIQQLIEQKAIKEVEPGVFIETFEGSKMLEEAQLDHYYPEIFINSGESNLMDFRELFLLANQVVSENSFQNHKYYPVSNNLILRGFVKQWFQDQKQNDLTFKWVQALQSFLKTLAVDDADRLVNTWTGHQEPGLRSDQLKFPKSWNEQDIYFWELDQYAKLVEFLKQVGDQQILKQLWIPFNQNQQLISSSMQQTYRAYDRGMPLEEISKIRNLKLGTVREHLLSLAILMPLQKFDYQRLLEPTLINYFENKLVDSPESWSFQQVRESGSPDEFFYFRLYQIQQIKEHLINEIS